MHLGSGSVVPSRTGFTPTGSPRPSRPGQIDPGLIEGIAGGADPSVVSEMSHASAAALLDRVHHSADPQVVERVLTLVDREGVDMIAELWSRSEPDSLPGIMWRLYTLRSWMRRDRDLISRLWRLGEPVATAASAIAGVDQAPTEADITHTQIDSRRRVHRRFRVALERASAFVDVVAQGLRVEARHMVRQAEAKAGSETATAADLAEVHVMRSRSAKLMHTAGNLIATSKDFRHGAQLWRRGKLD